MIPFHWSFIALICDEITFQYICNREAFMFHSLGMGSKGKKSKKKKCEVNGIWEFSKLLKKFIVLILLIFL